FAGERLISGRKRFTDCAEARNVDDDAEKNRYGNSNESGGDPSLLHGADDGSEVAAGKNDDGKGGAGDGRRDAIHADPCASLFGGSCPAKESRGGPFEAEADEESESAEEMDVESRGIERHENLAVLGCHERENSASRLDIPPISERVVLPDDSMRSAAPAVEVAE